MSEVQHLTRNYVISVWTLQDSFVTVLGASQDKYRGRVLNPEMRLVNDGTLELTFSIPMYLDNGVTREINPIWNDIYNAPSIVGMRKIKVIFNYDDDTAHDNVFEFVITKVTKIHDNDKPYCEVNCEGLAFHELGKIGYKIEFSTDVLTLENYEWYQSRSKYSSDTAWYADEPRATIDYWMQLKIGIPKRPASGLLDAKQWYYKVEMDWSEYSNYSDTPRDSDKIYDEEFVMNWNSNLLPAGRDSISAYKEKTRIMDEKESNIYNLTLKLAETFGVFCKYKYEYDDNYHIISRTIIFFNSGMSDKERKLSFTYPHSSTRIQREDDCTDIVTKMFVTAIEDESTDSGLVTIINSSANKTREDYLLNFDYLYSIKTITDELYAAIATYEKDIRAINDALEPILDLLLVVEDKIPKVEALLTTAKNSVALDLERINNSTALAKALTDEGGTVITVEAANAKTVALTVMDEDNSLLQFKAPENGIISGSLKLYTKDLSTGTLSNPIRYGIPDYDEFGNITRWHSIPKSEFPTRQIGYVTFQYSPKLYYENIEKVWRYRLALDKANISTYTVELDNLLSKLEALKELQENKINEKRKLIADFEILMGPALREGYWTPENYDTTIGERYVDYILCSTVADTVIDGTVTEYAHFLWDDKYFDEEQVGTFKLGAKLTEVPYPCIVLNLSQVEAIQENLDKGVGVLYYDYKENETTPANNPRYMRNLAIGASAIFVCIKVGSIVKPALLLVGTSTFTDSLITFMKNATLGLAKIGYLTSEWDNGNFVTNATILSSITSSLWYDPNAKLIVVYPRCRIDSLTLKHNETDLTLSYGYNSLKEFDDYYVFLRVDKISSNKYEGRYYITLKPMTMLKARTLAGMLGIRYSLSNASTAIYADAKEILKENSMPKVTYTLSPNVLLENFTYTAYNALNTIAFINDYELLFEGAQGYISSATLNLDFTDKDTFEIKNYKNKFEDLFATIVAQTLAMEKNELTFAAMTKVISADGSIAAPALEGALRKVDLNYLFNLGKLTISEKEGIWGTSDSGVVAFRGGGIFTATEKDEHGNWIWNTGIVPQGINANALTAGLIDTNRIKVYAGDRIRFQLNSDGLFAYKSLFTDYDILSSNNNYKNYMDSRDSDANFAQYVVMNEDGLFLCAKSGALVVNADHSNYVTVGTGLTSADKGVLKRVSITWDGLTLRNLYNLRVLYADSNTGNLTITGAITAIGKDGVFIADGNHLGFYPNENSDPDDGFFTIKSDRGETIIEAKKKLYITANNLFLGNRTDPSTVSMSSLIDTFNTNIDAALRTADAAKTAAKNALESANAADKYAKDIASGRIAVPHVLSTGIEINNNTINITATGRLNLAANSSITMMSDSSNSAVIINKDGITLASGKTLVIATLNFSISSAGTVSMTGTINANSGYLAGWKIEENYIWKGSGDTCVSLGWANWGGNPNANYVFWAGASWPEDYGSSSSTYAPVRIRAYGREHSGIHTTNLWLGDAPPGHTTSNSGWTPGGIYLWLQDSGGTYSYHHLDMYKLWDVVMNGAGGGGGAAAGGGGSGSSSGGGGSSSGSYVTTWGSGSYSSTGGTYYASLVPANWGWQQTAGGYYWYGASDLSSYAQNAWIQWEGGWYFFDGDGWMLYNTTVTIDNTVYNIAPSGACSYA